MSTATSTAEQGTLAAGTLASGTVRLATSSRPGAAPWHLEVRGTDPVSGRTGTWHLDAVDGGRCAVSFVAGHITSPAVWMQTGKSVTTLAADAAIELAGRVVQCC